MKKLALFLSLVILVVFACQVVAILDKPVNPQPYKPTLKIRVQYRAGATGLVYKDYNLNMSSDKPRVEIYRLSSRVKDERSMPSNPMNYTVEQLISSNTPYKVKVSGSMFAASKELTQAIKAGLPWPKTIAFTLKMDLKTSEPIPDGPDPVTPDGFTVIKLPNRMFKLVPISFKKPALKKVPVINIQNKPTGR